MRTSSRGGRALAALVLALAALIAPGCFTRVYGPGLGALEGGESLPWIMSAPQAVALLEEEGAVVLDARPAEAFEAGHVEGAVRVTWQQFSRQGAPYRGLLLEDLSELSRRISAVGVTPSRAVLVVGDPRQGWGEDGRIVWMLRALGHARAVLVDGGHDALAAQMTDAAREAILGGPGAFDAAPVEALTAELDQVRAMLAREDVVLIDTRELREFEGQTPYGERRGGHLPGAVHLHFEDFIDERGYLLAEGELRAALAAVGIGPGVTALAYCTGGVRSAWFVVVLRHLGFEDARNYAGSMWEWAAQDPAEHPLE